MSVHTCATFWAALRAIVPSIPENDVTRCVITLDPSRAPDPLIELTMMARDEAGRPHLEGIHEDRHIATETKRFKIVPDEDAPT